MNKTIYIYRHYASSPNIPGGTRHFNLASELVRSGLKVFIFASNYNHLIKREVKHFDGDYTIETVDGVKFVWINTFHYQENDWRRFVNIIDFGLKSFRTAIHLSKLGIFPNIIIGSIGHIFSLISAYLTSTRLKARFFIDIGELWPETFISSGRLSKNNPVYVFLSAILWFLYKRAEIILCPTSSIQHYFQQKSLGERTIFVPPGARIENNFSHKLAISDKHKFIYAGSFQPIYPLDNLIGAAHLLKQAKYRNIEIVLVGDGILKKQLIKLADNLQLDNVIFIEPMPKRDLMNFLKNGFAFVLIEKDVFYGPSNKLMDYLSIGRPIVYASPLYNENLLKSGCCIEALHDSPESIAAAIGKIESMNYEKWMETSKKSRQYYIDNYDIKKIAKKIVEVI